MEEKFSCECCGIPGKLADLSGISLEIQKDGKVVCGVCKHLASVLQDKISDSIKKKAKDFAIYIDASACMFNLDSVSVFLASGDIFMGAIDQISESNKSLAVSSIKYAIKDLEEQLKRIEEKVENKEVNKHE